MEYFTKVSLVKYYMSGMDKKEKYILEEISKLTKLYLSLLLILGTFLAVVFSILDYFVS
jgi:hypothetical protein